MRIKIREFLREDLGSGDITSELVVPADEMAKGRITCKADCVLAGLAEAADLFKELGAEIVRSSSDGKAAKKGDIVMEVSGSARQLLAGERLALNLIMRMSGIATLTRRLVDEVHSVNPGVRIAATRKTTPGFREFEKKAVLLGGGDPHRYGLFDAILVKDNHIRIAGGVVEALKRAKKGSFTKKVEVEAETREDAILAADNGADIILIDNFPPKEFVALAADLKKRRPGIMIEASGGITPETVREYAKGADVISLGWLTHSVRSIDFSMDIRRAPREP
jgi:nicotinate-nucleotide pyrophosphorylase (carboxylating)